MEKVPGHYDTDLIKKMPHMRKKKKKLFCKLKYFKFITDVKLMLSFTFTIFFFGHIMGPSKSAAFEFDAQVTKMKANFVFFLLFKQKDIYINIYPLKI